MVKELLSNEVSGLADTPLMESYKYTWTPTLYCGGWKGGGGHYDLE